MVIERLNHIIPGTRKVRFDDRLTTVLKGELPQGSAAAQQWRQIVDLLAQQPDDLSAAGARAGLIRLSELRGRVPPADRLESVRALGGRLRSVPLLVLLCGDEEPVARAAVEAMAFDEAQWREVAPLLPPSVTALLPDRLRVAASGELGTAKNTAKDRANRPNETSPRAEQEAAPTAEATGEPSQIRQIVTRISDYQQQRSANNKSRLKALQTEAQPPIGIFRFSTDPDGVIDRAEGLPEGAIVGTEIGIPAVDDGPGPDAAGAAAFQQRRPLQNNRMRLLGLPAIAGDWRITARPSFSESSGRFEGYRGTMRRPDLGEMPLARESEAGLDQTRIQQFTHELRTPLNAIIGFSEIIEQQLFGPVATGYREIASEIREEARHLLVAIDDMHTFASAGHQRGEGDHAATDARQLLRQVADRLQRLTDRKAMHLSIVQAEQVPDFAGEPEILERLFTRLLSACIAACETGEDLQAGLQTMPGGEAANIFWIDRPGSTRNVSEDDLLNLSRETDSEEGGGALLGLGFSFRLVRNLAQSLNGQLQIVPERFVLTLPAVRHSRQGEQERECD